MACNILRCTFDNKLKDKYLPHSIIHYQLRFDDDDTTNATTAPAHDNHTPLITNRNIRKVDDSPYDEMMTMTR